MEIQTYTEFIDQYDGEICNYWLELNKEWLLINSSDDQHWKCRNYMVDEFIYGGTGDGNYEVCWNDDHPSLGYEFCINKVAENLKIELMPDIEDMEWDGNNFEIT